MRTPSLLVLLISFCCSLHSAESWPDNFLNTTGDYEGFSLGEIYLALPAQLFEISYQERIGFLIRGKIAFNAQKKTIYVPGDGGQMTIIVRVTQQTQTKLVLKVTTVFEGAQKTHYKMQRTPHGWEVTEKH